jgi:Cupin
VAKFHLVLEGTAQLCCAGESLALAAGDLVVLPRGVEHTLAGAEGTSAQPLERLIVEHGLEGGLRLAYGGSAPLTRLLCGGFSLAEGSPSSITNLFPDVPHVPFPHGSSWLATMLRELKAEAESGRPGAHALVTKITDVFLAQALRSWLLDQKGDGLADPRLILEEPIAKSSPCAQQPTVGIVVRRAARPTRQPVTYGALDENSAKAWASRRCAT